MAGEEGYNGRDMTLGLDDPAVTVAAIKSKGVARSRSGVETTNDDSDGNQVFLPKPGKRGLTFSGSGVATVDNYDDLIARWYDDSALQHVTITHPNGATEVCDAFLQDLEMTGESEGFVAFSMTLVSSGAVTYTPAA